MEKASASDFCFNSYIIKHSQIDIKEEPTKKTPLDIRIIPSGVKKEGLFLLTLDVTIKSKSDVLLVNILMEGSFNFRSDLPIEHIKGYFTKNAPAIMFPYVRGYISMLTSLSGIGTINLPVLNLVDLGKELAQNITEIK